MTTKIQLRRDNSSDWTGIDPTLAEGEIGFETNTGKFKIGDGSSAWSSLDYFLDENLEFVIYNSQNHFKQSNIGLVGDNQNNIGGVTRIVGNKVFLYYEGDHQKLDAQIKSGISNAIINGKSIICCCTSSIRNFFNS
jgi:hypothetical protein